MIRADDIADHAAIMKKRWLVMRISREEFFEDDLGKTCRNWWRNVMCGDTLVQSRATGRYCTGTFHTYSV